MKEEEIRPAAIFQEYLRLAELDTQKYFTPNERDPVACPACESTGRPAFVKHGFAYECPGCHTLFVSPRPPAEAFSRYYQESASVQYWASTFYKDTAEARREKLWKPKAQLIQDLLVRHDAAGHAVVDIGGGYGIFAEEFERISGRRVAVVEPGPALAEVCRGKGLAVTERFLEQLEPADLPPGPKAMVSFELFEHLHDPAEFLRHLGSLMQAGDLFAFTTLSGAGVDIQALWEDSQAVTPPHHLNFVNPHAARILLERTGFTVLAISTPGKLDIDILSKNQAHIKDRFWRTFAHQATDSQKQAMQAFVADAGWSSHMLALCIKR